MNTERLIEQLLLHEGLRLTPYQDTLGNWTVGVGYNITGRGWSFFEQVTGRKIGPEGAAITREEALAVLRADVARVEQAVRAYLPDYDALGDVRQRVVLDLAFNMGYNALQFKRAINALKIRDWSGVARELYRSKWAGQVGDGEGGRFDRADRLAQMMLTGKDYSDA